VVIGIRQAVYATAIHNHQSIGISRKIAHVERLISLVGLLTMVALAWLMSPHKRRVSARIVVGGLLLQFLFAVIILRTEPGHLAFEAMGGFFTNLLSCVDAGSEFMFDFVADETPIGAGKSATATTNSYRLVQSFAFRVLPSIVFFSSLMSMLYYLGIMQKVVALFAWIMQKTLQTSGAESLSAAANIFVGQTEAPLVIRPYVASMTISELNAVMVGGFATIAGGVLAAYVSMGVSAGHLITASVISAPAALMLAKVMQPETEHAKTLGHVEIEIEQKHVNLIEAAASGASDGMMLAINVAAMLIAFLAIIAMLNGLIGWTGGWFGFQGDAAWTLEKGLGYLFYPMAWLMGIQSADCYTAGELLGIRTVANEFVAYDRLGVYVASGANNPLSQRSVTILTYAISGFANFSSIGIQIGGIGGIAPERRSDLARLGLRAMIGGTLACFMTACVAGILV
jgi:CNT family concentrative nucleoside transporter